jgi:hypothetical protein
MSATHPYRMARPPRAGSSALSRFQMPADPYPHRSPRSSHGSLPLATVPARSASTSPLRTQSSGVHDHGGSHPPVPDYQSRPRSGPTSSSSTTISPPITTLAGNANLPAPPPPVAPQTGHYGLAGPGGPPVPPPAHNITPPTANFTANGNPIVPVGISGGKMFKCLGFGTCEKVFTRSEHLARHVR